MQKHKVYTWRIVLSIAGFIFGCVLPYGSPSLSFMVALVTFYIGFCIDVIVKRAGWKKEVRDTAARENAIATIAIMYVAGLEAVKKYDECFVSMHQDGLHIQSTVHRFIISKEQISEIEYESHTGKGSTSTYKDIFGTYKSYTSSSTSHFLSIGYKSSSGSREYILFMGSESKIKDFVKAAGYGKPSPLTNYDSKADAYRL